MYDFDFKVKFTKDGETSREMTIICSNMEQLESKAEYFKESGETWEVVAIYAM